MKTYLRQQIKNQKTSLQSRNFVREYLQARILEQLQHQGAMIPLAFQGGTALRFLYDLPRYSEDLDFALEQPSADYHFRNYLQKIQRSLEKEGYEIRLKINDQKIVHAAFVRFPGLLYDLDLSPHRSQVLAVKLGVDTQPPSGAGLETTVIRRQVILQLQHHDQASLLAGKIHAFLQRDYVKGRDIYDLLWYLSQPDWPDPNLKLLNNALYQSGWNEDSVTKENWREILRRKLKTLPWKQVTADVAPFLETQVELSLLTRENLLNLLD